MAEVRSHGPLADTDVSTVVIYVEDLERMLRFYRDVLGLKLEHQTESYVELRGKGGANIALHAGRRSDGGGERQWFLEFKVDNIEAAAKELGARGVEVSAINERWWGKDAGFTDPEGNRLELEEPDREVIERGATTSRE